MWVRQYRRVKSDAKPILKRMRRQEEMAKKGSRMSKKSEVKSAAKLEIPPEKYFRVCNGAVIKDIDELAVMIGKFSDDEFRFHVNESKNDFSNWIRDVFGNNALAENLIIAKNKCDSQALLLKHVEDSRK